MRPPGDHGGGARSGRRHGPEIVGDAQVSVVESGAWAAAFGALEAAGLPAALVGRTLRLPGAAPAAVRRALGDRPPP